MEAGLRHGYLEGDHSLNAIDVHVPKRIKTSRETRKDRELEETRKDRELEERLVTTSQLQLYDLPDLLSSFADKSLQWSDSSRRLRAAALLLTYVTRASQACCEEFLAWDGLVLLGEVLCNAVASLENAVGLLRDADLQDTGLRVLACLRCLRALQLSQAPTQQDITSSLCKLQVLRPSVGTDQGALGGIADLSKQAKDLCELWQSTANSAALPTQGDGGSMRSKVVELIAQGLLNMPGGRTMAAKVEVALFALHGGATQNYRSHARMLKSNLSLAGNLELRVSILSGRLAVEQLVALDSTALAPQAMQEERRIEQQRAYRESLIPQVQPPPRSDGDRTPARSDGEGTPKPSPSL